MLLFFEELPREIVEPYDNVTPLRNGSN